MKPTVAHYCMIGKLGEGGMGEVWKAQDTKLDRIVALKVLPADKVSDPDRRRRFVQEAKAASALNHPHIVTIYEIGSDDGLDYIAMEYVAGQTLGQCIGPGGIPFRQAIRWAIQISDALARAHARGIVHRDVKPGNVMIAEDGEVKLLDFGLSKLVEPVAGGEHGDTATMAQTPHTEAGKLLGTVAYMSPEQAEGRPVDVRSDIFSFGALLYEAITGRQPFVGDSKVSVLAGILREEPPAIGSIATGVPQDLEKIIARCLRKDPARRYQHMDDVCIALEDLKQESESGISPALRPSGRRAWPWAAGIMAAVAAIAALWFWAPRAHHPPDVSSLKRVTYDSGLTTDATLSPDGRLIAYASDRAGGSGLDIWVQQLAGGDPTRITSGPEDEYEPQFSPDGTRLAFRSDASGGGIYTISALGGKPRLVVPAGRGPRYSPDGARIAFWKGSPTAGTPWATGAASIWLVSANGGPPQLFAPEFAAAAKPEWTADGKHIVFIGLPRGAKSGAEADFWVAGINGEPAVRTGIREALGQTQLATSARYAALVHGDSNRYYFSLAANGAENLWTVRLSPPAWKPEDLHQVTHGTQMEVKPSVSANRIVFTAETDSSQIWSVTLDANTGRLEGHPEQLTHGDDSGIPVLSRDGRKLSYLSHGAGEMRSIVREIASGEETVAASGPQIHHPVLSPDGEHVAYRARPSGHMEGFAVSASGGMPQKFCDGCGMMLGWSNDGRQVLFKDRNGVSLVNVASGERSPLLQHPTRALWQPDISPDGRWVLFLALQGEEQRAIYIAPFRPGVPPEDWIAVTPADAENDKPRWSPNGEMAYYTSTRDGYRCIWTQRLNPATKRPVGDPVALLHFHSTGLSLSNVSLYELEMSVARDRLVFVLGERGGNIWMTAAQ